MIAELCFTCRRDAALAASTDRPRVGVRRIWVVDACDADIIAPPGVEVWVVSFERPGNLNGWACMEGMFACFVRAFAEGAIAVIKRDSDTAILDDGAFTGFAENIFAIGVHQKCPSSQHWHLFGCCYALAADSLPILRAGLDSRDWPGKNPKEDETFSWWLRFNSRVLPWTSILFTKNVIKYPGEKIAENRGNKWELDSVGNFASPPRRGAR